MLLQLFPCSRVIPNGMLWSHIPWPHQPPRGRGGGGGMGCERDGSTVEMRAAFVGLILSTIKAALE